jgi:hypothetical protein
LIRIRRFGEAVQGDKCRYRSGELGCAFTVEVGPIGVQQRRTSRSKGVPIENDDVGVAKHLVVDVAVYVGLPLLWNFDR